MIIYYMLNSVCVKTLTIIHCMKIALYEDDINISSYEFMYHCAYFSFFLWDILIFRSSSQS